MRNEDQWVPTKFIQHKGSLKATKNRDELSVGSRLIASIVADLYGQALPVHATGRLLDMGCGQVPFYAAYRDHVSETVCIDWANSPHRIEHLDMECDLTGEIPFPDASFDTIILSDVLEHLPDPKLCWQEIARLLKPGGKLIMNVPFYYPLHEEPNDHYRYTRFALQHFAQSVDLDVVELKPIGGALEVLADIVSKLLTGIKFGRFPAALIQSGAIWFSRTSLGQKASDKSAEKFPFGYFMIVQKPA